MTIFERLGLPSDASTEEIGCTLCENLSSVCDTDCKRNCFLGEVCDEITNGFTNILEEIEHRARAAAAEEVEGLKARVDKAVLFIVADLEDGLEITIGYVQDENTWRVMGLAPEGVRSFLCEDGQWHMFEEGTEALLAAGCNYANQDAAFAALAHWQGQGQKGEE